MLTFEYKAKDTKTGKVVRAHVQATSEAAASKLLTEQGLSPLEIKPLTEKGA